MNEEEKQAIEYLERHILPYCREGNIKFMLNDVILNLIKKQQKEIEDLKEKNKKLQDKGKELIFEKQELTSALLDSIPKDKIIKLIKEKMRGEINKSWRNTEQRKCQLYAYDILKELIGE